MSGYEILRRDGAASDRAAALYSPDPGFYFSTDSEWLEAERHSWATRQRGAPRPEDAVHFLLDGRDGYVEILASGFTWRAWTPGSPQLNSVSGDPIMSGKWSADDIAGS